MNKKNSRKLAICVIATMAIIITVWGAWFYPKEIKKQSNSFESFTKSIEKAFSIFKKEEQKQEQSPDIQDLRQRVFGDKIEK